MLLSLGLLWTFAPCACGAPTGAIETLRERLDSVVTVSGQIFDGASTPQTQAALDPQTGKIVTLTARRLEYHENKGAGVIISPDGRIVTNTHIIFGSQRIMVTLRDGTEKEAHVLFVSHEDDFSILKIETDADLPAVEFADSQLVSLGDEISTIGHSDLLNGTISGGVISGLGTRETARGPKVELLRLNINHYLGDSGGPVFDRAGRLVGLMSSKRLSAQRELFAVASNKIHFADINLANAGKNQ
jgi:S1-C subfamily serine protease